MCDCIIATHRRSSATFAALKYPPPTSAVDDRINSPLLRSSAIWRRSRLSGSPVMASAGKTLRMLRCGIIQFLASDCHNLKMRPPRMQEAARRLSRRLGDDFTADFFRREEQLLREGCAWYA